MRMVTVATKPEQLSKWIEANIHLPLGTTAEPGPIHLYAYQRGIADAIADPKVERVSVLKSARVGYTVLLTVVRMAWPHITADNKIVVTQQKTRKG